MELKTKRNQVKELFRKVWAGPAKATHLSFLFALKGGAANEQNFKVLVKGTIQLGFFQTLQHSPK